MLKKFNSFLFFLLAFSNVLIAQTEKAAIDVMRSNGKIYVVMAVCLTILVGLITYLVLLDRKINKLEKEVKP